MVIHTVGHVREDKEVHTKYRTYIESTYSFFWRLNLVSYVILTQLLLSSFLTNYVYGNDVKIYK